MWGYYYYLQTDIDNHMIVHVARFLSFFDFFTDFSLQECIIDKVVSLSDILVPPTKHASFHFNNFAKTTYSMYKRDILI